MIGAYARRVANIRFALAGISTIFQEEKNVRIFAAVGCIGIGTGFALRFPGWTLAILLLAAIITLALEMINSAVERVADLIDPRPNPKVKAIKDIAAGAIFLAGLCSVALWFYVLIFVPKT